MSDHDHPQTIPGDNLTTELDPERQRTAKEYAGIKRRLFFVELGLALLLVLALLFLGWSAAVRDWAGSISTDPWLVVALYTVALGVGYTLVSLPLDFYSSYVLPHRYGLSTQSLGGWVSDTLKELAIGAVLGLGAMEVLYWLLRTLPDWWWLVMAALAWLFMVAMTQLAPVLLMPLFYKFRPLEDAELVARLTRLAEGAGAKVRGVYVMDMSSRTTAANAMLTGLGSTRRIILGDTLLSNYTYDEIETVLAHELAHHVHNDLPRGLAAEAVILLASMGVAAMLLNWGVPAFGFRGIADVAALPLFMVAMTVVGMVAMPLGNFLTRQMERAADRYAIETTRKPQAFRSVMLKLAGQNLAEAEPPRWVRVLFHSHPSIAERVAFAEDAARNS
ncbi:MAG: M48 family metallopeptidase [Chloroflexota bacterium]|nr:M48 family metallopeptidase [Chloroflexota bacterium]